jgi:hypothetical protein
VAKIFFKSPFDWFDDAHHRQAPPITARHKKAGKLSRAGRTGKEEPGNKVAGLNNTWENICG